MTATLEPAVERSERERHDERYRIYSLPRPWAHDHSIRPVLLATAPDVGGLGQALVTLRGENTITADTRVGIKDDVTRTWIINPWAVGDE